MSLIKRISATLTASVDNLVDQVENHDAVIEASIKKVRQAAADTRVRLGRLQKDRQRLEQQINETKVSIRKWQDRALSTADEDQKKALQCLQRKKEAERSLQQLEQSLSAHKSTERQVADNLKQIESRITEMNLQRNNFRSRESAAKANQVIQKLDSVAGNGIEDTFDRWESALLSQESYTPIVNPEDEFDDEFNESEVQEELELELQELINKNKERNND
ncbi:MAG: PspA/IM30 family protein [Acidiferrobacterales bacterium]|nr:PspA/IM30 family protein [Acidiferrobacterales bacterium]